MSSVEDWLLNLVYGCYWEIAPNLTGHDLPASSSQFRVGIPRRLKVYPVGVRLIWPVASEASPRRRSYPDVLGAGPKTMARRCQVANGELANRGRKGRKGLRRGSCRWSASRTADGPPQRDRG